MMRPRVMPFLFYALFFLSGSAGLGYQMVWSRMIATGLGQEMPAVLAVIAAFMGGMARGACTLDGAIARSRRAGCWYGWPEIYIRAGGFLSEALILLPYHTALRLIGLEP